MKRILIGMTFLIADFGCTASAHAQVDCAVNGDSTCCEHPVGIVFNVLGCPGAPNGVCTIKDVSPVSSNWPFAVRKDGWSQNWYNDTITNGCRYKVPTCVNGECKYLGNEMQVDCATEYHLNSIYDC